MTQQEAALGLTVLCLAAAITQAAAFLQPLPASSIRKLAGLPTRARGLVRASVDAPSTPAAAAAPTVPAPAFGARTKQILDSIQTQADATGGAGSSIAFSTLEAMDRAWTAVKTGKTLEGPVPTFVTNVRYYIRTHVHVRRERLGRFSNPACLYSRTQVDVPLPTAPAFDVVVCGGTLGIFMATALQLKGFKVCVVERGPLQGRAQEWNISRKELMELVAQGVLAAEDAAAAVSIDFNPCVSSWLRSN